MPTIDLVFTLTGSTIPRDHGYPLYRAVGRLIPQARLVVIDGYGEAGPFRRAIQGTFRGMGIRSTFRVQARGYLRKRKIPLPGFRVVMTDLIPEDSLVIQAEGLGDFRRMGCGIFVSPARANGE